MRPYLFVSLFFFWACGSTDPAAKTEGNSSAEADMPNDDGDSSADADADADSDADADGDADADTDGDADADTDGDADADTDADADADTDADADSDADADADAPEAIFDFKPTQGTWVVDEMVTVTDECGLAGFSTEGSAGTTLQLSLLEGDSFRMAYDGGGTVLDCDITSDEGLYDCDPALQTDTTAVDMGIDCTIEVAIHASGHFVSTDEVSINSTIDMEGTGSGCTVMATMGFVFPCSMETESNISLQL